MLFLIDDATKPSKYKPYTLCQGLVLCRISQNFKQQNATLSVSQSQEEYYTNKTDNSQAS